MQEMECFPLKGAEKTSLSESKLGFREKYSLILLETGVQNLESRGTGMKNHLQLDVIEAFQSKAEVLVPVVWDESGLLREWIF